jgi:hypothetical protein
MGANATATTTATRRANTIIEGPPIGTVQTELELTVEQPLTSAVPIWAESFAIRCGRRDSNPHALPSTGT